MTKFRGRLIAALDIGTTKVVCLVARVRHENELEVVGIGHQVSQGVKAGIITDIKAVEACVLAAVNAAEQMAGLNIDQAVVNISGSRLASKTVDIGIIINGNEITDKTLSRLMGMAVDQATVKDRSIIHCIPYEYRLDDESGIKDPRGMYGNQLLSRFHVVSVSSAAIVNITNCLARCQLDIQDCIISAYASSLACLSRDEKELGVVTLDMGGGNTSVTVFKQGKMVYADSIPLGGVHVTMDLAQGLTTDIANAERIKTLHGSVIASTFDEDEVVEVPQIGEDEGDNFVPRASLAQIIRPRVEEIFEMIQERLRAAGLENTPGRMVLTGGAAQLLGVKELSAHIFNKQVRIASPQPLEGLAESTKGPAFSSVVGMLKYAAEKVAKEKFKGEARAGGDRPGYLPRLFFWFRENF